MFWCYIIDWRLLSDGKSHIISSAYIQFVQICISVYCRLSFLRCSRIKRQHARNLSERGCRYYVITSRAG